MGGLVSRNLVHIPGFIDTKNYNTGLIHKLISIDTPHEGTYLANELATSNLLCQSIFAAGRKPIDQGAVDDLAQDSALIGVLHLPSTGPRGIPTHAIVGRANATQQETVEGGWFEFGINGVCDLLPNNKFKQLFQEPSDLIVPESSQSGSKSGISMSPLISNVIDGVTHETDPIIFTASPDVLTSPKTIDSLIELLNSPLRSQGGKFSLSSPFFGDSQ
jgi:hypothetical protein